jgi:hypothetical protein
VGGLSGAQSTPLWSTSDMATHREEESAYGCTSGEMREPRSARAASGLRAVFPFPGLYFVSVVSAVSTYAVFGFSVYKRRVCGRVGEALAFS